MDISPFIKHIAPITLFNKGKASQMFSRVKNGETLVVIKNNSPIAIIMSPEEYDLLQKFPKMYMREIKSGNTSSSTELTQLFEKLAEFDMGEQNV